MAPGNTMHSALNYWAANGTFNDLSLLRLITFTTLFVDKDLFVGHVNAVKMPFSVFGELGSNFLILQIW